MPKKILISIRRWFKSLIFRLFHREGWASKFAKEVLSSGNGAVPVQTTRAFKCFVEEIGKIERSRKFTKTQKMHLIEWEKKKLQRYWFAYRYPDLEIRRNNEELMRNHMAQHDYRPNPIIFVTA
jgi:hypothetical protein